MLLSIHNVCVCTEIRKNVYPDISYLEVWYSPTICKYLKADSVTHDLSIQLENSIFSKHPNKCVQLKINLQGNFMENMKTNTDSMLSLTRI